MDDAWMGAMTDITHDVQMDGMDNTQMGGMTDLPYDVWTDGDFTGVSCR